MQIDVIGDMSSLDKIRGQWDRVYDGDPEAHFFLSWTWMSKWLSDVISPWVVLAARPDDGAEGYVAFFPLRVLSMVAKGRGVFNNLEVACRRTADRTGFICLPEHEDAAIPALAKFLATMHWANLSLEHFAVSERRFSLFLDAFPKREFKFETSQFDVESGEIDHHLCLTVNLPDSWETYLTDKLSAKTRHRVRNYLRKLDAGDRFRITYADQDTIENDIDILLHFWALKWGRGYGEGLELVQQADRTMIRHCFDEGVLLMPVLWEGERPLGAIAILVDRQHMKLLFKLFARDETFLNPSPGVILIGNMIRYAIGEGFKACDFLQGNHAYKYAFGVDEFTLKSCVVFRKSASNMVDCLDRRWLDWAVALARHLQETGHGDEAIKAYRQILRVDPSKLDARPPLAQLLSEKGHHAAATRVLEGPAEGGGASAGRQHKTGRSTRSGQKTRGSGGRRRK